MEKIIRKKSKDLLKKLPDEKLFYQSKDFIQAGFPAYLSTRIRTILTTRMLISIPMPESDWVNTESEDLQKAWQQYAEAMKKEIKLPADSAAEVIEKAIENCLKLAVQPRRAIPELLFNSDNELSLDELKSRVDSISINGHLAYALVRYMEKKDKKLMSFEAAKSVIEKIDEKLVSDYNPLNWLEILKPLFSMAGPSVDSDLFRIFFEEKGKYPVAKKFDLLENNVDEMEFVEIMSSGEFLDFEYKESDQPGFFNRTDDEKEISEEEPTNAEEPLKKEDNRNHLIEITDDEEEEPEDEDLNSLFTTEEESDENEEAPFDLDDDTPVRNQKSEMGVDDFDEDEIESDEEIKPMKKNTLDEDDEEDDLNSFFKSEEDSLIDIEPEENAPFGFTEEKDEEDVEDKPFMKRTSETETGDESKEKHNFEEQEIEDEEFEKLFKPDEDADVDFEKSDLFNVKEDANENLLSVYKPENLDDSEDEEEVPFKADSDEEVPLVNRFRFDDSVYDDEEDDDDEPATIYSELNLVKDNREEPSIRSLFETDPETDEEIEQSEEIEKEEDTIAGNGESGTEKYPTKYIDTSEPEVEDEDENTDEELPMWRSFLERDDVESDSGFQFDESEDDLDDDGFIEEPIFDFTQDSGVNKKFKHIYDWLNDERKVFIKKLFGDSDAAYEQALADIVEFDDWKKASKFIEKEIFSRNRIDMYDETAIDFTDRLHSYFLENKS